jgi:hypothetical protein
LRIGEPQRPQKTRWYPGEDSHCFSNSSPATKWNDDAGIVAPDENAEPDILRHKLQWQFVILGISPSISYFTPPQRQEPLSMNPPCLSLRSRSGRSPVRFPSLSLKRRRAGAGDPTLH